jgi:hypothetical protein
MAAALAGTADAEDALQQVPARVWRIWDTLRVTRAERDAPHPGQTFPTGVIHG